MAKCEKRQIVPTPPPVEYVLTLSESEARALEAALTRYSFNVYTEAIRAAVAKRDCCDA